MEYSWIDESISQNQWWIRKEKVSKSTLTYSISNNIDATSWNVALERENKR